MMKISIFFCCIVTIVWGNDTGKKNNFVNTRANFLQNCQANHQWNKINLNFLCDIETLKRKNESQPYSMQNKRDKKYMQTKPEIIKAPRTPLLPFFVGFEGNTIHSTRHFNGTEAVVRLARRIVDGVINPEEIVGENTLSRFNTMVGLIRTLSENQIECITNCLYTNITSKTNESSFLLWEVYRDAVIQAGTGPSIVSLFKWIRDDMVSGEEAAQLVSTITNTAEYPTEEFMRVFFEIIKITDSNDQGYVHASAVLAFGSLIKKVYVCHKSMELRFPVNSFGRPVNEHSVSLEYVYLHYLTNKLRLAIDENNSHNIQTYTRAIGNTAHPKILEIFKPFLNGHKITNFQRLLMVMSLDSMTIVHPEIARSVLYKIYFNIGENSEIRSAAVTLLMRTNPPVEMLQRMAEATNWDSSEHVNAVVKSAIESAAATHGEMGKKARKVVNFLTAKTYGFQYSTSYIKSYMNENDNLGYSLNVNSVQSPGSIIPSAFFFTLRPSLGKFIQRAYKYSWMIASTDDLIKLLSDQIVEKDVDHYKNHSRNNMWTTANIDKILGIQHEVSQQVEGNLYITLQGARRFITFDNHVIKELPKLVKFASSAFRIGDTFNYTKLYNQFSLRFAFPTELGLPFVFTVEAPTLVSLIGEARINSHPDMSSGSQDRIRLPQSLNLTTDFKYVFSSKTEAKLGFITPFNHQHFFVGYDGNIHISLPLKIKIDFDVKNKKVWAKMQPLYPTKYQKIFERSTIAYTTKHDILNLSPPQLGENSEIININILNKCSRTTGHHMTGFAFDLKAETEHDKPDIPSLMTILMKQDLLSATMFFDKKNSIEPLSNYTISYNPHKTTAKFAKFVINYADVIEYSESEEQDSHQSNGAIPSVGLGEHKKRVENLLKRSKAGMRGSYAQAIDISTEFEGETNGAFIVTAAYARSHVSQKARYLFFFAKEPATKSQNLKPFQMALDAHIKIPNVPLGNFKEALKSDPTSIILARLNFGEKASNGDEVVIKGQLEKSVDRINYLKNHPLAILCEKQMNESNYFLQACHNVTTRANYMDQYYFRIDYQNVMDGWRKFGYSTYSLARQLAYPYATENAINHTSIAGRIELFALLSPDLRSLNASLITPSFSIDYHHIDLNEYLQTALVFHPHSSIWDRLYERIILSEKSPRCVVDDTYAITFDNVTYPIFTGRCWHVTLHFNTNTVLNNLNNSEHLSTRADFTILTREVEMKQREMMILLGEDIIRFQATAGKPNDYFTVNDQQYEVSEEVMGHFEDKSGTTIIQAFKHPLGTIKIFTPVHGLVILYDGLRIEIQAPSQYRGKVHGLCGTFDGEKVNDFMIPKKCILKNPLEFSASYAVSDGFCQGPIKELKHTAQNAPCYEQSYALTDLTRYVDEDHQKLATKNEMPDKNIVEANMEMRTFKGNNQKPCNIYDFKILNLQIYRKICVSVRPQLSCATWCHPTSIVEHTTDFHCLLNSSIEALQLKNLMKKGPINESPFKDINHRSTIKLPVSCNHN